MNNNIAAISRIQYISQNTIAICLPITLLTLYCISCHRQLLFAKTISQANNDNVFHFELFPQIARQTNGPLASYFVAKRFACADVSKSALLLAQQITLSRSSSVQKNKWESACSIYSGVGVGNEAPPLIAFSAAKYNVFLLPKKTTNELCWDCGAEREMICLQDVCNKMGIMSRGGLTVLIFSWALF